MERRRKEQKKVVGRRWERLGTAQELAAKAVTRTGDKEENDESAPGRFVLYTQKAERSRLSTRWSTVVKRNQRQRGKAERRKRRRKTVTKEETVRMRSQTWEEEEKRDQRSVSEGRKEKTEQRGKSAGRQKTGGWREGAGQGKNGKGQGGADTVTAHKQRGREGGGVYKECQLAGQACCFGVGSSQWESKSDGGNRQEYHMQPVGKGKGNTAGVFGGTLLVNNLLKPASSSAKEKRKRERERERKKEREKKKGMAMPRAAGQSMRQAEPVGGGRVMGGKDARADCRGRGRANQG